MIFILISTLIITHQLYSPEHWLVLIWVLIGCCVQISKHFSWENHLNGIKLHCLVRTFLDHSIVLTVCPSPQPDPCPLVDPRGPTPPSKSSIPLIVTLVFPSGFGPCSFPLAFIPYTVTLHLSLSFPFSSPSLFLPFCWPMMTEGSQYFPKAFPPPHTGSHLLHSPGDFARGAEVLSWLVAHTRKHSLPFFVLCQCLQVLIILFASRIRSCFTG